MTPDQAHRLLDGTTPGPWGVDYDHAWEPGVWSPDSIVFGPYYDREDVEQWEAGSAADLRLAAAAPALAAMIAGMHAKYGVEVQRPNGDWLPPYSWHDSPEQARNCVTAIYGRATANRRVVRRYVTEPEEIT